MIIKWTQSRETIFEGGGQGGRKMDRAPSFNFAADTHELIIGDRHWQNRRGSGHHNQLRGQREGQSLLYLRHRQREEIHRRPDCQEAH